MRPNFRGAAPAMSTSPTRRALSELCVEVPSPELTQKVVIGNVTEIISPSCSICFEKPRAVRNRPCGHAVCCGLCTVRAIAAATKTYTCPACRTVVTDLEWHGTNPSLQRMATDGRNLSPNGATRSTVYDFLRARATEQPENELGEASRKVLAAWGVEAADPVEAFPLVAAAESGDADAVARLLAGGADVNLADGDGWTPLIAASANGNARLVTTLLAVPGVHVNATNDDEETALVRAAASGSVEAVSALLGTEGLAVNASTRHGKTALIIAAGVGDGPMTAALLASPLVDVNAADGAGETALLHAAGGGHASVVATLLEHPRLNTAKRNGAGQTPLMVAVDKGHEEVATALRVHAREKAVRAAKTERAARTERAAAAMTEREQDENHF